VKSLKVSMEQGQKILKCPDFSRILVYKENHFAFINVKKLINFYENGYRPIFNDYWLGMRMASEISDLNLCLEDSVVELIPCEDKSI